MRLLIIIKINYFNPDLIYILILFSQRMQSTLSEQTEPDGVTDSENVSESCTEYSMDCLLSDNCPDSDRSDVEATQERDKIVNVCSEIKARFNNDMASGEEEVV